MERLRDAGLVIGVAQLDGAHGDHLHGDELGGARKALGGILGERAPEDGVGLRRDVARPRGGVRHGRVDVRGRLGGDRVVLERT